MRNARATLILLSVFQVACHKTAPVQRNGGVGPVLKDTAAVGPVIKDAIRIAPSRDTAPFKDTTVISVSIAEARIFGLRTPAQRQSVHAMLRKERALWEARKPRDYRFLLRVACFCPGVRGWLLIEVQSSQPLRAWDRTGRSAAVTDWNTFSIDGLYDNLERAVDNVAELDVAFDPRWHFPVYVRTVALPGPDAWAIIDARGLRVLAAEPRR